MKSLKSKLLVSVLSVSAVLLAGSFFMMGSFSVGIISSQDDARAHETMVSRAAQLGALLDNSRSLVEASRDLQQAMLARGKPDRPVLEQTYLSWLVAREELFAVWSLFKPGFWQEEEDGALVDYGPWAHRFGEQPQVEFWQPEAADRESAFYQGPSSGESLTLTEPYFEEVKGEKVLLASIAMPVKGPDGTFVGATGIDFSLNRLEVLVKSLKFFETGSGYVVDSNGLVVCHPDRALVGKPAPARLPGERELTAALALPGLDKPWVLVAHIPEAEILSASRKITGMFIGFGLVFIAVMGGILWLAITRLLLPLKDVTQGFRWLFEGDFTHRLEIRSQDELGALGRQLNVFNREFSGLLGAVLVAARQLDEIRNQFGEHADRTAGSVGQVIKEFHEVEERMTRQVGEVEASHRDLEGLMRQFETLRTTIEMQADASQKGSRSLLDLISRLSETARDAQANSAIFTRLVDQSQEGSHSMEAMAAGIRDVQAISESLEDANKVISSIASHTNLLAMNAAIEAAHAGEAGKGFAVVAQEIRTLAEHAAEQSSAISSLLESVEGHFARLGVMGRDAGQAFDAISQSIARANESQSRMAASLDAQNRQGQDAANLLAELEKTTSQVTRETNHMESLSGGILRQNQELTNMSHGFKSQFGIMVGQTRDIETILDQLRLLGLKNRNLIESVMQALDRFRIQDGVEAKGHISGLDQDGEPDGLELDQADLKVLELEEL